MTLGPQFDKLFHGTNADLNEGDIIHPGYHNEEGVGAYATGEPEFAMLHATAAAERRKTSSPEEFSGGRTPYIYEVAPISPHDELTVFKGLVGSEIVDPKGLRVVRKHQ